MIGCDHGVLFQNYDGNINMGVWFNDPDIEINEILWYNILSQQIHNCAIEGLISVDPDFGTKSCYAELHRIGFPVDFISIRYTLYLVYALRFSLVTV